MVHDVLQRAGSNFAVGRPGVRHLGPREGRSRRQFNLHNAFNVERGQTREKKSVWHVSFSGLTVCRPLLYVSCGIGTWYVGTYSFGIQYDINDVLCTHAFQQYDGVDISGQSSIPANELYRRRCRHPASRI